MFQTGVGISNDLLLSQVACLSEISGNISISGVWDYKELWYHLLNGVWVYHLKEEILLAA